MKIVIPLAGKASRFKDYVIESPKPLLDVFGVPLAVRAAQSIQDFGNNQYLLISLVEHKKWGIESRIKEYFPNSNFIYLKEPTRSPVETCLKAANELEMDKPVVFNDCDQIFKCPNFDNFLKKQEISIR
jgi:NDP-sugar pyrophosphorylase family protein